MKRKLSLIAISLIALSCTKEIKEQNRPILDKKKESVSLSQAVSMMQSSTNNGLMGIQSFPVKTTNLAFGQSGTVQSANTDPNIIYRTHGEAKWANGLELWTENYNNEIKGSGIAVRYPFKQGRSYTIELSVEIKGLEIAGESIDVKTRKPSFQLQLTNSAAAGIPSSAPIQLVTPGPVTTISTSSTSHSINFFPTECYNFLRFSALPNMTGISRGIIDFGSIKIIETNGLEITGSDVLDVNTQSTYSVEYGGLNIDEQFNWAVTGDLQIIGSNTGSTAIIKAVGINGGKIIVGLNGCQEIAEKEINVCGTPTAPDMPTATSNGKTQMIITITGSSGLITGYNIYLNGTYLKSITTNSTSITVPCGVSKTLGIEAYNSCGVSPRTNRTIVGCEIDTE